MVQYNRANTRKKKNSREITAASLMDGKEIDGEKRRATFQIYFFYPLKELVVPLIVEIDTGVIKCRIFRSYWYFRVLNFFI